MNESTPQYRQSAAALRNTPSHTSLRSAALAFIAAQSHNPSLPSLIDFPSLRLRVTPSYSHTFGPAYFVSQTPKLQGAFTIDAFIEHLGGMVARLERWEMEVKGCVVDEGRGEVVVRVGYEMFVKGEEEGVENEVVWWLELDKGLDEGEGEGELRVKKSLETVDPVAAGRVRELMMGVTEARDGDGDGTKDPAVCR